MSRVTDKGPGIPDVALVLSGRYRSTTGMGIGLIGAHRLMDRVEVKTRGGAGHRRQPAQDSSRRARRS